MVRLVGCCYFFGLRTGCIISALWLLSYYGALAYFMYYQMKHTQRATVIQESREYDKETLGFWVLGIAFIVMGCTTLLLVYGTLRKKYVFLFLFLVAQWVPISVELYYLLTAIIYGIEFECFVIYLVPLVLLFYMDLVVYSYFYELRSLKRLRAVSEINIEY
ncbi:uncharacterized protein [Drosophila takahashii]|uniref:uncharacterized protein n=1 Tax=Drosophila takahashii TaxID=29030 RepID=UPI001CF8CA84|nr:uncharacterized protein LOC108055005 [Drosophila takahashii]